MDTANLIPLVAAVGALVTAITALISSGKQARQARAEARLALEQVRLSAENAADVFVVESLIRTVDALSTENDRLRARLSEIEARVNRRKAYDD
jgi:uncharacterized membrane protein